MSQVVFLGVLTTIDILGLFDICELNTQYLIIITYYSGFGGLEVACWPLVPKFAGSNPAEAVGFLRVNKNPQHVGEHGCLSVVSVVCCQVEVSATN